MPRRIDDCTDELMAATHFSDVRDLYERWSLRAPGGLPPVRHFADYLSGPRAAHVMLLTGGDDLVYRHVGRSVARLFGHDPLNRRLADLENGGVRLYRERYIRCVRTGTPLFCVEQSLERALVGSCERLMLPVATDEGAGLLVYIRLREDGNAVLRAVFDASADGIFVLRPVLGAEREVVDFRVIAANREVASRLGVQPSTLIGRLLTDVYPIAREVGLFDYYHKALLRGEPSSGEFSFTYKGELVEREIRVVPLDDGIVVTTVDIGPIRAANRVLEAQRSDLERRAGALTAANDAYIRQTLELSEEIRRNQVLQQELERLAHVDGLTGVANRARFEATIETMLKRATDAGIGISLAILDLDHFKDINDSLGHRAGDLLLREIAGRIVAALGPGDLVGRLGGDEFAIAMIDRGSPEATLAAMCVIMETIGRPYVAEHRDLSTTVSVGLACFPGHGRSAGELLSNADIAVYRAKRAGRGRLVRFEPAMRAAADTRFRLLGRFRQALEAGEIVPYYQPVIRAQTGLLDGFEVLARWRHPEEGVLTPARFLDVFEEPDLAVALQRAIIARLIDDLTSWGERAVGINFGVNVTGYDLRQPQFADELVERFSHAGFETRRIVIEVTEGVILSRDSERVLQTIAELRAAGFRIALDDFGTGYAGLTNLRELPADIIKIDQSFVRNCDIDAKSAAIVRAVVDLARAFGLRTVAEGVETPGESEVVRLAGCNAMQGFLFSGAVPASGVPALLRLAESGRGGAVPTPNAATGVA